MAEGRATRLQSWLERLGSASWLIVGIMLVVLGAVWLLAQTATIVGPLIAAAVVAAVASPAVAWLQGRRIPRTAGSGIVMLGLIAVGLLVAAAVFGGITSHASQIDAEMTRALGKVQQGAEDVGITSASQAVDGVKAAVPDAGHTVLRGVAAGVKGFSSIVVFLGFSVFIAFFLLKDGPAIRAWGERRAGLRHDVAHVVIGDVLHALRKYFLGLTIVSAFNGVVVGVGAVALGVPLAGTIALVTFIGGFVPILGAWTAGIFAFALALAAKGTSTALLMALVVFLANGPLQQIVQPITYGATLQLNPLVVFISTIAAGALFGMIGLALAAPLVSAGVHIHDHLANPAPRDEAALQPAVRPERLTPWAASSRSSH